MSKRKLVTAWLVMLSWFPLAVADGQVLSDPFLSDDVRLRENFDYPFALDPVVLDHPDFARAKELYAAQDWEGAAQEFAKFAEQHPADESMEDALFLQAECLVQLGKYDSASALFRQLIAKPRYHKAAEARFRLGECAMLGNRRVEAERLLGLFRRAHPQHPLNAYALPYLADLKLRAGKTSEATQLYEATVEGYPAGQLTPIAQLQLAVIRLNSDQVERAIAELRTMADSTSHPHRIKAKYWLAIGLSRTGERKAAFTIFQQLAETHPNHPLAGESACRAGEGCLAASDHEQAAQLFRWVRETWDDETIAARAILGQMRLARKQDRKEEVLALLEQLRNLPSAANDQQRAVQLAAEVLIEQREYAEAIELVQPSVDRLPKLSSSAARKSHFTNLYLLALAHRGLKQHSRASELLNRIRLEEVEADVAQRVVLARIETLNAGSEFDDALEEVTRFQQRFPNSELMDSVRAERVVAFVGRRELARAEQELGQMQSTNASTAAIAAAARHLSEAAYERGHNVIARSAYNILRSSSGRPQDRVQALSGLAWLDAQDGRHEAATRRFAELIRQYPNHEITPTARLAYAESLEHIGQPEQAIEVLREFQSEGQSEFAPRIAFRLARLLQEQGHVAKAETLASALTEEHADFEMHDAGLYLLGNLRQRLDMPTATDAYQKLTDTYPDSSFWSDAMYRQAKVAADAGDVKQALQLLNPVIEANKDPKTIPHAIYLKGRLASQAERWPAARETLRDILRDYPDHSLVPLARYGVAESFYQEKQFARAQQLFDLLDTGTLIESNWGAMVKLRRAQLQVAQGKWLEAIQIGSGIRNQYPDFSLQHEVDYLLGRSLAARGSFREARKHYNAVVAGDMVGERELTAMAHWMIGESLLHQKDYDRAIESYRALKQLPFARWRAASLLQIGTCRERLADPRRATEVYTELVTEYPDSRPAAQARQRLQRLNDAS